MLIVVSAQVDVYRGGRGPPKGGG
eukprot:COSAG01_NODE_34132_length_552_cov_10.434879_1_plen_23_part_01